MDSTNPYAAPTTGDAGESRLDGERRIALRGTRLKAATVDSLLITAIFFVSFMLACILIAQRLFQENDVLSQEEAIQLVSEPRTLITVYCAMLPPIAFYFFQCYLVAKGGQSLAKRWFHIRIVRRNGEPAGFVHGVLLRAWVMAIITAIPLLGYLVGLVDVLAIFGRESRCLHDMLADTIVVDVPPAGAFI